MSQLVGVNYQTLADRREADRRKAPPINAVYYGLTALGFFFIGIVFTLAMLMTEAEIAANVEAFIATVFGG